MPSFRFAGFSTGSVVALTVAQGNASAQAALTWGQPGGGGSPNATFSIVRADGIVNADLIAPVGMWFRATNFSGFSVSEPAGTDNQYDPTQRVITFIWELPDEGYTPLVTPNTPTVWKSRTIAYGKQIAHVFTTPGAKLVRCFAFDDQGNWGLAEFTTPAVLNPETVFAGANTIYFSPTSNFPSPLPSGAQTSTNAADCRTKVTNRFNAGANIVRVSVPKGDTLNEPGQLFPDMSSTRGGYFDSWGSGAPTIVNIVNTPVLNYKEAERHCTITGIDFRGNWDSTTETGIQSAVFTPLGKYCTSLLVHRCKFGGFEIAIDSVDVFVSPYNRIMSDCDVTNWANYGLNFGGIINFVAIIDCDIHQHVDALNGINQGSAAREPISMGNLHGPLRFPNVCPNTYLARNSFFSRNNWPNSQSTGYTTSAPTVEAACIRFNTAPSPTASVVRHHHMWDRNTFEGGGDGGLQLAGNGSQTGWDNGTQNLVIDKAILIAGSMSSEFTDTGFKNTTFRNILGFLPNLTRRGWGDGISDYFPSSSYSSLGSPLAGTWVHNCTILNARADGTGPQTNTAAPFIVSGLGSQSSNNIYRASFKGIGASFEPLGTSAISGVVCRNKGQRFGFPPIGIEFGSVTGNFKGPITVSSVRVGGPGNVLNGEFIDLPYPNYSGLCDGAGSVADLSPMTQSVANALPSHFHQLSIRDIGQKRMTDINRAPGSKGGIEIEFRATTIRVKNVSGLTWTAGSFVWLQLDLSPYLMSHIAVTASNGTTVPAPIPQAGSAAIAANRNSGTWAHGGILADYREGVKTPPSGVVQTGKTHKQGAFA
jgi:hypothetical protein